MNDCPHCAAEREAREKAEGDAKREFKRAERLGDLLSEWRQRAIRAERRTEKAEEALRQVEAQITLHVDRDAADEDFPLNLVRIIASLSALPVQKEER